MTLENGEQDKDLNKKTSEKLVLKLTRVLLSCMTESCVKV